MTPAGAQFLRKELARYQTSERIQNMQDIERAREHGDISENAEFEAAKERQAFIEGKIIELESKISNAEIIDPSKLSSDRIVFGATVTVEDADTGGKHTYQIVGEDEADVKTGRISVHSPIARGLIGKEVGDTATVLTPGGSREVDVLAIEYK
jgi:transcription elongation factor GreA